MLNFWLGVDAHSFNDAYSFGEVSMRLLQSLTRGLQALDFLREKGNPARLTDVAQALGVGKSNASHILNTLVFTGYATQDGSRHYRPTRKGGSLREESRTLEDIIACKERWRPVLERLVAKTGECAHLAVFVDSRVWYVDKIDSTLPLKVDHPIGSLAPLHCTALGKVFLAFVSVEQKGDLVAYTPKTILTPEALQAEIARTRQLGYAIDDEEFASGIRCVARPIMDDNGCVIAALGISGPTVRIDDARLAELGRLIVSASASTTEEENLP